MTDPQMPAKTDQELIAELKALIESSEFLRKELEERRKAEERAAAAREQWEAEARATMASIEWRLSNPAAAPTPPNTGTTIRLAVHDYDGSTPVDVSGNQVFDLQRGPWWKPNDVPESADLFVYATTVRRAGDPDGLTQFQKPSEVSDARILKGPDGKLVWRARDGGEYLVNFADPVWQAAAFPRIMNELTKYGSDGLYLDEVDQTSRWAWGVDVPDWKQKMLNFVTALGTYLHQNGKRLWVNLGADYDAVADPWQAALLKQVDGVNIEFFVGRVGVGQSPAIRGDWLRQVRFVKDVESLLGKQVHVHASTDNQSVIDYAFLSWLLSTEFRGSFSAGLHHDGARRQPSGGLMAGARSLGRPTETFVQGTATGLHRRAFERGTVWVNSAAAPLGGVPAMTGKIVLT